MCVAAAPLALIRPVAARAAVETAASNASSPDFRKGVLSGQVVDTKSGAPVANAIVAIQDRQGHTLGWTKTGADGRYRIAADTLRALQLDTPRPKGSVGRVFAAVGDMLAAPVRLVGDAFHMAPADTVRCAASTLEGPAALAGAVMGRVGSAALGRVTEAAVRTGGDAEAARRGHGDTPLPGEAVVRISALGYKEVAARPAAYWLDAPASSPNAGTAGDCGVAAHLEPVALAPASSDATGGVRDASLLLEDLQSDTSLVPAGDSAIISVKLTDPEGRQSLPVRVFARLSCNGSLVELQRQDRAGRYAGCVAIPAEVPSKDILVTVVAVRAEPVAISLVRENDSDDPLRLLLQKRGELNPDGPYRFDPRLFAARNRLVLHLTVLGTKEETPPPAPATAPAAPAEIADAAAK